MQLVAAVTAARRTGMVPVVGLLSADQVADLNDLTTTANLVQQGIAEAAATAEEVQNFAPMVAGGVGGGSTMPSGAQTPASTVGVAPPDLAFSSTPTTPKKAPPPMPGDAEAATPTRRPIMKAPPQVPATTWRVTPLDQLPRKAAPTSTATSGTSMPHVQVKPMPQRRLPTSPRAAAAPSTPAAPMAPMPSAPPTPAQHTGGGETPVDYFVTPAAKARAAARLAAGADPFDATLSMSASASGLATPAQSVAGRRPPNMQIRAALNVQTEAWRRWLHRRHRRDRRHPRRKGRRHLRHLCPRRRSWHQSRRRRQPTSTSTRTWGSRRSRRWLPTHSWTPLWSRRRRRRSSCLPRRHDPRRLRHRGWTRLRRLRPATPGGTASTRASAPGPMTTVPEEDRPEPWEMPATQRRSSFPRSRR